MNDIQENANDIQNYDQKISNENLIRMVSNEFFNKELSNEFISINQQEFNDQPFRSDKKKFDFLAYCMKEFDKIRSSTLPRGKPQIKPASFAFREENLYEPSSTEYDDKDNNAD